MTTTAKYLEELRTMESEPLEIITAPKAGKIKFYSAIENLLIESLDGKMLITDFASMFRFIDPDFRLYDLDQPSSETAPILVDVKEFKSGDATLKQIFLQLSEDLEKIILTPAQILRFCLKFSKYLSQGDCGTFFPTRIGRNYYSFYLYSDDGWYLHVTRLQNNRFDYWSGGYKDKSRPRVVARRLTAEEF
ncbi:MAG: hypothetical protein WCW61_03940 [Patescibacteria group bacterium]|jgi:hypothetical protein